MPRDRQETGILNSSREKADPQAQPIELPKEPHCQGETEALSLLQSSHFLNTVSNPSPLLSDQKSSAIFHFSFS